MLDIISGKIFEEAIAGAMSILKAAVRRKNDELLARKPEKKDGLSKDEKPKLFKPIFRDPVPVVQAALRDHVEDVSVWCKSIKFSDLQGVKLLNKVYVDLDTYLMPISSHASPTERAATKPLLQAVRNSTSHCAILGTAGAGKSTSLQKICLDGFRNGKFFLANDLPILLRLRGLVDGEDDRPVTTELCNILALHAEFAGDDKIKLDDGFLKSVRQKVLLKYIDGLNAVILLDGYDELASEGLRSKVEAEVISMMQQLKVSKIIITSRSIDFRYKFTDLPKYEISPLTQSQIGIFAERWLDSKEKASDFLAKVFSSPFADTTMRPLTIAHLCAIYERIQDIPEKPKSVYRRVVQLLLEDWDSQRRIKRPSAYGNFDNDRKFEVLASLAYYLTAELRTLTFSHESLRQAYADIREDHGLPENQSIKVIGELESHSGLILESGHGLFEFSHKSIQEYLAADFISRLPQLSFIEMKAALLPNELAIATALSSKPAGFLVEIFLRVVNVEKQSSEWLNAYLDRLASEKPDLQIGRSKYSAIAVMLLIGRSETPTELLDLLQAALPKDSINLIGEHYTYSVKDAKWATFRRTRISRDYRLPENLRIPADIFKRMAEHAG